MKIRKMTVADIPGVISLGTNVAELAVSEQSVWWGDARLRGWVEGDQDILLVAEDEDQVVGVQLTWVHHPTKMMYLSDLVVKSSHRGHGIGGALVKAAVEQAASLGINWAYGLTQPDNTKIHKLLTEHGFVRGENLVWFEKKPL